MNFPLIRDNTIEVCSKPSCKDDNTLGGEIAFSLLFVYTAYIFTKNVRNLHHLANQRKKINVHKLLIINVIILIFLAMSMVMYFDGVIRLVFSSGGFLNFKTYNIIQTFTTCCLQIIFSIGYFNWSALFATVYEKPKKVVRRIAMLVLFFFVLIFIGIFICMSIVFDKYSDTEESLTQNDPDILHNYWYKVAVYFLSGAVLVNSIIFIFACQVLIKKLRAIYYFSSDKVAKKMKSLIMFTMVASILRAVLDVVFSFFSIKGYQILRKAIYENNATNLQMFYWFVYMFGFFLICNLIPTRFLLMNFSPIITKSNTIGSLDSDNAGSSEDMNRQFLQRDNEDGLD